ncbi:MAG TPA: hypothetical protein VGO34_10705 [Alphaproteobacteria bacterium]|jgi:hypothetical protein
MSDRFDPYEYIGVIVPGSVAIFGTIYLYPDVKAMFGGNDFNVGGLGLFLIASLVVGHLIQGIGNLMEMAWWRAHGGMPSDWLLKNNQKLVSETQKQRLLDLCSQHMKIDCGALTTRQWYPAVREMYSVLESAGRAKRVDAFNRTYGLLRGISAGCLVFAALAAATAPERHELWIGGLVVAIIAFYRMQRFGKRYAREIFVAYLGMNNGK